KDHITLGTELNLIDIDRGVKLAGSRSYFLIGDGALLHQAVLRLAQDMMIERGFMPMTVPVLVREPAMVGTGYFPLGREQSYVMSNENPPKYLVGTAEVSLTAYHMDETLDGKTLPRKYVAMSPCFRRDAGTNRNAYGETHSASRFYDFQARRLNLRYRDDDSKTKICHTLNNTVIASPRVLIPILELYQNADGSVTIPAALRPYMNGRERISK